MVLSFHTVMRNLEIPGQWFHIWAVFLLVPLFRTHGSYVSMFPTSGSQLGPASLCGVTLIHAVHYFWKNFRRTRNLYYICTAFKGTTSWSDARVVEEARLESVYTSKAYRGFESPLLRRSRCDIVAAAFLLGQFVVKPRNSRPSRQNSGWNLSKILILISLWRFYKYGTKNAFSVGLHM